MNYYGNPISTLIQELAKLPGIGGKSAQRLAFYIINQPEERANVLAEAILNARKNVRYCSICCNLTDDDPCDICRSVKRDPDIVMVVEDPRDMAAYERINEFRGLYHVLHGAISPLNGIAPGDLKIKELLGRIKDGNINEIIIATNPNIEGEATAMYIGKLIKPLGIRVTRIAHGVPIGGSLEHVDEVTLAKALDGRREI